MIFPVRVYTPEGVLKKSIKTDKLVEDFWGAFESETRNHELKRDHEFREAPKKNKLKKPKGKKLRVSKCAECLKLFTHTQTKAKYCGIRGRGNTKGTGCRRLIKNRQTAEWHVKKKLERHATIEKEKCRGCGEYFKRTNKRDKLCQNPCNIAALKKSKIHIPKVLICLDCGKNFTTSPKLEPRAKYCGKPCNYETFHKRK
jgi:hypothetical protein